MKKILILWRNSIPCSNGSNMRYFFIILVVIGFVSCRGNGNDDNDKGQADSLKTKTLDKADKFKDSIIPLDTTK